jgi:mRNA interferase MazF
MAGPYRASAGASQRSLESHADVIGRGELYRVDLGEPRRSEPARRRPVLVIQADPYTASRLNTVLAAVVTSNTSLAAMPGNIFLPASASGLPKDSVVNVTALITVDKTDLDDAAGAVPDYLMNDVDAGLRRVLDL